MKNIREYLEEFQSKKVYVWLEEDKLKFRAKRNEEYEKIIEFLKKHKSEIIEYLKHENEVKEEEFDLTSIQRSYLMGQSLEFELGGISAHYYLEYKCNNLNVDKLEKSINNAISRNDALRIVFTNTAKQKVLKEVPHYNIKTINIKNKDDLIKIRDNLSHKSYTLDRWPLFEFVVSQLNSDEFYIHISFDCIILDAMSARLLMKEIITEYKGGDILEHKYSFKEYMCNVEEYKKAKINDKRANDYWESRLSSMYAPELSFEKPIKEVKNVLFKRVESFFTEDETVRLYETSKKHRFTPTAVIATAFLKALSEFSINKNITINMPIYNRLPLGKDIDNILGDFTNISFVSYFYNEEVDFYSEVKEIQKQFWKTIEYRHFDGVKIINALGKNEYGKAVMPVVFTSVLNNMQVNKEFEDFEEVYSLSQTPQVFLDHHVRDDTGKLKISWDYVEELFSTNKIEEMFNCYKNILKKIIYSDNWINLMV